MKTTEAVKWRWEQVFSHFGLPWVTGNKHVDCPICGSKKSFRVDNKDGNGTYICKCSAGDAWKLLAELTGQDFKFLAKRVDQIIGNEYRVDSPRPVQKIDKAADERNRFLSLPRLRGTDAENYLNSRGIYSMPKSGCRFSSGEYDTDEKRLIPCIYSIASNEYGEPVYKHLTYIESGAKANIEIQRKMFTILENHGSVSIKLFTPSTVLGISEGIETALSAASIYKMPCWSVINATLLKRFRAPTGVTDLYIFADNDKNGTGLAAAFECGRANIMANNDVLRVFIRWPQKLNDFNDLLTGGDEVIEWCLIR